MKVSRSVLGKRLAPTSVRPAVREAARLCIEAQRSPQIIPETLRLRQLAAELGVHPHDPRVQATTFCRGLESVLGQEWRQAVQEALAEEQHVQSRQREIQSARQAQANAVLRQAALERRQRQDLMAAAVAPEEEEEEGNAWQTLPPELRLQFIDLMVDAQPREVIALYQANRTFHGAVDYLRHPFYAVQEPGSVPTEIRLPLIEYVRLATNFDAHSALELFMAMALCVVKALANIILHTIAHASPPSTGHTSASPSGDMTAPISQALGGNVVFQLAQWYSWVSWHALDPLNRNEAAINGAIEQVYGWTPQHVFDVRLNTAATGWGTQRSFVSFIRPVSREQMEEAPDFNRSGSDVLLDMTRSATQAQLGHLLSPRAVQDLLNPYLAPVSAIDEAFQRMVQPDAQRTLQTLVNDRVAGSMSGACARATRASSRMPTLMQLNSGWAFVGFSHIGAFLSVRFQSNAIEWALAQATGAATM